MTYTSEEFVASVTRLVSLPKQQSRFTNEDFLLFGNRKMQDTIIPVMDSLQQEFFVTKTLSPIVSGTDLYAIPPRALGRKLRELKILGPSGGRWNFPKIDLEREQFYRVSGLPFGFYFYGDRIALVPTPQISGYSLQYWWLLAPSKLVRSIDAATVTSVAGDVVTVSSVPSNLSAGLPVDFIQGVSGNSCLGLDATIVSIVGNDITFNTDVVPTTPFALSAGDYISLAGTSPIVQLPDTVVPYLTTVTAIDMLIAIGDLDGANALKEIRDEQNKNVKMLHEPRIEGESSPIINDYGFVGGPNRMFWGLWRGGSV